MRELFKGIWDFFTIGVECVVFYIIMLALALIFSICYCIPSLKEQVEIAGDWGDGYEYH